MESYSTHHQRPLTPPNERKAALQQEMQLPHIEDKTSLNDIPHLNETRGPYNNMPPVSTAPSAPLAPAQSANPFVSRMESKVSDVPFTSGGSRSHYGQRNETTHRIEREVATILKWKNPARSALIFGLIVGSILLTRWYSLLQIVSSGICLATGINLIYVNFVLQSRKVVASQDTTHPYSDVINNEERTMINRNSVSHYSNIITDVSETIIRALTRIIFVENTRTSLKWMGIFFLIWKVSSVVSTMNIILTTVISAFIFPRLYISNKDIVDAHIQKGQTLLHTGINKAQTAATEAVNNSYSKSRAFVAHVGTTGTDAKNTLAKTSATLKED